MAARGCSANFRGWELTRLHFIQKQPEKLCVNKAEISGRTVNIEGRSVPIFTPYYHSVSRLNTWPSLEHTRRHQHPRLPTPLHPLPSSALLGSMTVRTLLSSLPITTSHTCLPIKCRVHSLSCVSEVVHARRGSERCYPI